MLARVTSYELEVRETDVGEIALGELAGELDLTNAEELERRLEEIAAGVSKVVLDLNGILFFDSAALHVLFRFARRLEAEGKAFGLVLPATSPVAKTLSIVSFDQVATIRPSFEDVLADLSG